jgi:hypothetical protein
LEELGFSWDFISTHKRPVDADKLKKMENDNELNWVSNHELSPGCAKYLLISEPTPKGLAYKNYYSACYYNQTEGHFVTCGEAKDVFHPPFYMRIFMAEKCKKFVKTYIKDRPPHKIAVCSECNNYIRYISWDVPQFYEGTYKNIPITDFNSLELRGYLGDIRRDPEQWGKLTLKLRTAIMKKLDQSV